MLKDSIVEGSESVHTIQETFGKHRSMGLFSTVIHPEGFASKAFALNGTLFDKRHACGSVYLSVSFGVLPGHNPYDNTSKFQNMSKPMQKDANMANESTTDKSPQLVSQEEAVPRRAAAAKEKGVLEASRETEKDEGDKADKWKEEEAAAAMKRAQEGETARKRAEETAAKRAEEQEAAQKTAAEEAVVAAKKKAEEARRAAEALAELARAEKAGVVGGGWYMCLALSVSVSPGVCECECMCMLYI